MPTEPQAPRRITARLGWLDLGDGARLVQAPCVELDATGSIVALGHAQQALPERADILLHDLGEQLIVPGLVNAHSHAFQRAIRGQTGRRGVADPSSFWSWRQAMYACANALDVEGVYETTRRCFAEMLASGITCVGEFHYLHHRPDGSPYAPADACSDAVIRAAKQVGIRLTLLEVFYERAGHGQSPLPEQRRFCDPSVEHYLERVEALQHRGQSEGFGVGVAPHSVRAVSFESLQKIASFARAHDLVMHAHVSEQQRENDECAQEHGCSPMALFERAGCLSRPGRFTAVHAIALEPDDYRRLSDQRVCACPTTEADLGDGIVPARELRDAGTSICLGSDSNAVIDLVQEARLLEMNERLARKARLVLSDEQGQVAPGLLTAASEAGANSLGQAHLGRLALGSPFDAATFDLHHRSLRDVPHEHAVDALMLSGSAGACDQVWVGGERKA